jgi:hypothetical protein
MNQGYLPHANVSNEKRKKAGVSPAFFTHIFPIEKASAALIFRLSIKCGEKSNFCTQVGGSLPAYMGWR